jgi:hypothetical protein
MNVLKKQTNREELEHQDPRIRIRGDSICAKVDSAFFSYTKANCSEQRQGSHVHCKQVTGAKQWALAEDAVRNGCITHVLKQDQDRD